MKKLTILAGAALLTLLTGCSFINNLSSTAGIVVNAVIQSATDEIIIKKGGTTAAGKLAVAKQVKAIAQEIQQVATGQVTLAQLQAALGPYIAKLSPPEQVLANALIDEAVVELGVQVQKGLLDTAATAVLADILNNVIIAAQSFGA